MLLLGFLRGLVCFAYPGSLSVAVLVLCVFSFYVFYLIGFHKFGCCYYIDYLERLVSETAYCVSSSVTASAQ